MFVCVKEREKLKKWLEKMHVRKSLQRRVTFSKSLQSVKICVRCTQIFTFFREWSCKDLRPPTVRDTLYFSAVTYPLCCFCSSCVRLRSTSDLSLDRVLPDKLGECVFGLSSKSDVSVAYDEHVSTQGWYILLRFLSVRKFNFLTIRALGKC